MASHVLKIPILTAEQYLRTPDDGRMTELVRGRIVEMNRPYMSHGYFCFRIAMLLGRFVEDHSLGRIVTNDSGVITQRDPDTVRGPDVAFYSFNRIPQGQVPKGYWPISPELTVEVRSPDDRWKDLPQKTAEYLNADVVNVVVIDPERQRVHVFSPDRETIVLDSQETLTLPDVLPGFSIAASRIFE